MNLSQVLEKHHILQQYENWYVLDDKFSWNLETFTIPFLDT